MLEAKTRDGCAVFGYADDTIIVATGSGVRHVVNKVNLRIRNCFHRA